MMELILDTANLKEIQECNDWYNIAGITTNPTILSREKMDFYKLLDAIKNIIGTKQLHVQVTAGSWEEMVREGVSLKNLVDPDIFIKVPSNCQGYRAMKELKEKNINVTATVVYSPEQAYIDALANVNYVAVYYNKMYNVNMDAAKTVEEITNLYRMNRVTTKVLAASFRNTRQVMEALLAGADAVTIPYSILKQFSINPLVSNAVSDFSKDWENFYGAKTITQIIAEKTN